MNCPRLIQGTHWTETADWPVVLIQDIPIFLPVDLGSVFEFRSGKQLLATHERKVITLRAGYACDGYSPVIRLFGKRIRLTPTPRCGMFPAIIHDFLRQFLDIDRCPWTRKNTDDWFFDALVAGRCPYRAAIYHSAVAGPLGTAFIHLTRKQDPSLHILRTRYPFPGSSSNPQS